VFFCETCDQSHCYNCHEGNGGEKKEEEEVEEEEVVVVVVVVVEAKKEAGVEKEEGEEDQSNIEFVVQQTDATLSEARDALEISGGAIDVAIAALMEGKSR
jgi:NACalpha-BTF3-like transcription factor